MINETTINQTVKAFETTIRHMIDERRAAGSFTIPGAPGISIIVAVIPAIQANTIMQTRSHAEEIAQVATQAAGTFQTLIQAASGIFPKKAGR